MLYEDREAFSQKIKELRESVKNNRVGVAKKRLTNNADDNMGSDTKSIERTLYKSIADYIVSFESGHPLPADQLGRVAERWFDIANTINADDQPSDWDAFLNTLTKISVAPAHYQSGSAAEELKRFVASPDIAEVLLKLETI